MATGPGLPGPVVVDTMIVSWVLLDRLRDRGRAYEPHLTGRPVVLAAQTVAEQRAAALINGWGPSRRVAMESRISRLTVAPLDDAIATAYAELKASCRADGHGLGQKVHDGDRWIAATAIRHGLPLVSDDRILQSVPGLDLVTERAWS